MTCFVLNCPIVSCRQRLLLRPDRMLVTIRPIKVWLHCLSSSVSDCWFDLPEVGAVAIDPVIGHLSPSMRRLVPCLSAKTCVIFVAAGPWSIAKFVSSISLGRGSCRSVRFQELWCLAWTPPRSHLTSLYPLTPQHLSSCCSSIFFADRSATWLAASLSSSFVGALRRSSSSLCSNWYSFVICEVATYFLDH